MVSFDKREKIDKKMFQEWVDYVDNGNVDNDNVDNGNVDNVDNGEL